MNISAHAYAMYMNGLFKKYPTYFSRKLCFSEKYLNLGLLGSQHISPNGNTNAGSFNGSLRIAFRSAVVFVMMYDLCPFP